jgi:predicted HTH transcriptional regulator
MIQDVASELTRDRLMRLLDSPLERADLDFKETVDLSNCHDRVELAKDVLAMANSGGGHIVVGVEDKTCRKVGISKQVSEALQESKNVNDKLKKYWGGYIRVLVAQYDLQDSGLASVRLALVRVPAARTTVPAQGCSRRFGRAFPRKVPGVLAGTSRIESRT